MHEEYIAEAVSLDVSKCGSVIYGLLVHLSDWAFEELRSRFVRVVSPGKVVLPAEAASHQFSVDQCVSSSSLQDFCALLRCCIIMLHLLEFDFNLSMEKSQILLEMVREMCSPDVVMLFLLQGVGKDRLVTGVEAGFESFPNESGPPTPFLCSVLEVISGSSYLCPIKGSSSSSLSLFSPASSNSFSSVWTQFKAWKLRPKSHGVKQNF